ncbi:MAG: hypothetical protein MJE63_27285 [Proteobacteria bacterium]|nr:hypothetical protein [Pseudomonadota bacterium]
MKWSKVVTKVESIDVDTFKTMLAESSAGSYVLIDVRQPAEYAKSHIPGAVSMPMNDLIEGNVTLPDPKPIIVYSRQGGRSKAAVQWFVSQDFEDVKEIEGGFDSWTGNRASGQFDLNIGIIRQDVEFPDAVSMAYAMEEGLRQFYLEIARETVDETYKKLYRKLASFEVEHKQALADSYSIASGKELIEKELQEKQVQLLEGGGYADETLIKTLANTDSPYEVFSLAIAFETQAFDFYLRLSQYATDPEAKKFFLEMADAEKEHLAFVTKEMDKYLDQHQP